MSDQTVPRTWDELALFAVTIADSAPEHKQQLIAMYEASPYGTDDYAQFLATSRPSFKLAASIDLDRATEGKDHCLDWQRIKKNFIHRTGIE